MGSSFPDPASDKFMQITAVSIPHWIPRNELTGYLPLIDRNKAIRLERYHRDEDFLRGLLGDLLVRHMVRSSTGLADSALVFGIGEFGKPFLVGHPCVQFNLSHSGTWVVCVLDKYPVGVDVEQINPVDLEISRRLFSDAEHRQIINESSAGRLEQFFNLWTLKESYIKMTGNGLSQPLNEFSVVRTVSGDIKIHKDNGPIEDVFLGVSGLFDPYRLAVCASTRPLLEAVEVMSMEQLLTV
jgi:4'-phosphopantetheinyl transferase